MSAENGRLSGRLALVTGAGSGIGKEIAVGLAAEGADVVGTGTKQSSVEAINETLGDRGFGALLDLGTDPAEIEGILKEILAKDLERRQAVEQEAGKRVVQVLVNNGGIKRDGPAGRMSDEDWNEVINVNLSGTAKLTREVVRAGRKEQDLRVITISSVAADGHAFQSNYAASKAGLIGLMRSYPGEQNTPGGPNSTATFNTIIPGLIDTEIISSMPEDMVTGFVDRIPAKRLGTPSDVSRLAVFLALPESGYINGAVIPVDGGATAGIHV